jgi:hypothetical protein
LNRHQRKERDRIYDILERVLAVQEQMLKLWTPPEAEPSSAVGFHTFEDAYLVQNLKEAAQFEDAEAKEILDDPSKLEAYLASFR